MNYHKVPELESLTWVEARDLLSLRPVGLLPIGAIEAHGPHLPLNSDVIIARGMARAGAALIHRSGIPVTILPAISYTVSFAGSCFAGTSPVSQNAFSAYLTEVLTNLADQGYRAICLCNAHLEPAHIEAINVARDQARAASTCPIVFPDQRVDPIAVSLGDEFTRGSRHAGNYETSIVMAEEDHVIRRTALEELEPVWIDLPAALAGGARDFAEAGADLGYFGDPAAATADEGRRLLGILGEMINDHVVQALSTPD